jgi:hypothetical protein
LLNFTRAAGQFLNFFGSDFFYVAAFRESGTGQKKTPRAFSEQHGALLAFRADLFGLYWRKNFLFIAFPV